MQCSDMGDSHMPTSILGWYIMRLPKDNPIRWFNLVSSIILSSSATTTTIDCNLNTMPLLYFPTICGRNLNPCILYACSDSDIHRGYTTPRPVVHKCCPGWTQLSRTAHGCMKRKRIVSICACTRERLHLLYLQLTIRQPSARVPARTAASASSRTCAAVSPVLRGASVSWTATSAPSGSRATSTATIRPARSSARVGRDLCSMRTGRAVDGVRSWQRTLSGRPAERVVV